MQMTSRPRRSRCWRISIPWHSKTIEDLDISFNKAYTHAKLIEDRVDLFVRFSTIKSLRQVKSFIFYPFMKIIPTNWCLYKSFRSLLYTQEQIVDTLQEKDGNTMSPSDNHSSSDDEYEHSPGDKAGRINPNSSSSISIGYSSSSSSEHTLSSTE